LLYALSDGESLLGRDVLLHFLQNPIRAGFGAEEDHGASRALNGGERGVRVAGEGVDTRFAPPAHAKRRETIGKFARVAFFREEIHVVELDGIGAVFGFQVAQDGFRALRTFDEFTIAVECVNTAKTAAKRAADAGVMRGSALAEKRRAQVFFDRDAVERRPGKRVGRLHEAFGIVPVEAEDIFIGKAEDFVAGAIAAKGVDQFEKRVFALAADDVVDVARIESGVGVGGREVATPHDGQFRVALPDLAARGDGRNHLRTGHDRNAQEFDVIVGDEFKDGCRGVFVHVAVDDLVVFTALEDGSEGHDGKRKAAIAWPRSAGIEKDDHWVFT